jgi:hypothetical protein
MTDVVAVVAEMSWWVKSGWLVWLAWVALQVAWYRRGHRAWSVHVAASPRDHLDASRPAPAATTPHPSSATVHAPPSSHRRRRRARRPPAGATDLADGVEAAR